MLRISLLISSLVQLTYMFTPPNMGGAMGCVVTKNKLFSHGNYIRDLHTSEAEQVIKYKKAMADFKKKIDDAFENAEKVEAKNSTVPPMPLRPSMPSFCTGPDTTLYIFGGCTIQNHKVYIGKALARELDSDEQKKLAAFIKRMNAQPKDTSSPPEFCTEFA